MKKIMYTPAHSLALLITATMLWSCSKYKEVADAPYPDQVIYMPTAASIFHVMTPSNAYEVPTPGQPYHFRVDQSAGKVFIPLGVVRGGVSNSGSILVAVHARPDTVSALIDEQRLNAELLPEAAYSIPSTITLRAGESSVSFDLAIDLPFLRDRPNQSFSVGVGIWSAERKTNPALQTTVVVFNTDLLAEDPD